MKYENCDYNPKETKNKPIGMYHCPKCGEMVLAGQNHPDYTMLNNPLDAFEKQNE